MAFSGTPEEQKIKRAAWNARRRVADKARRAELAGRVLTESSPGGVKKKYTQRNWTNGHTGTRDQALIRQLTEEAEFVVNLRDLPDDGSTSLVCPSCKQTDASWEEYFCRHCGEHNDALYLKDHALAPVSLNREEIVAEYTEVGLRFLPRVNPMSSGLKNLTYADLTGIDHNADMPPDPVAVKGGQRWEKLKGFRPER